MTASTSTPPEELEAIEATDPRATAWQWLVDGGPLSVKINNKRGVYRPHPQTQIIALPSQVEFYALYDEIEAFGLHVPLLVTRDGQIIDGRVRACIAEALDLPLRAEWYDGDEDGVLARVEALNAHRRHLNAAQRVVLVIDRYLDEAKAEAAKAKRRGNAKGGKGKSAASVQSTSGGSAAERAAEMAGNIVSGRSIAALKDLPKAPAVRELIRIGEITTVSAAVRAIEEALPAATQRKRKQEREEKVEARLVATPFDKRVEAADVAISHLLAIVEDDQMPDREERAALMVKVAGWFEGFQGLHEAFAEADKAEDAERLADAVEVER